MAQQDIFTYDSDLSQIVVLRPREVVTQPYNISYDNLLDGICRSEFDVGPGHIDRFDRERIKNTLRDYFPVETQFSNVGELLEYLYELSKSEAFRVEDIRLTVGDWHGLVDIEVNPRNINKIFQRLVPRTEQYNFYSLLALYRQIKQGGNATIQQPELISKPKHQDRDISQVMINILNGGSTTLYNFAEFISNGNEYISTTFTHYIAPRAHLVRNGRSYEISAREALQLIRMFLGTKRRHASDLKMTTEDMARIKEMEESISQYLGEGEMMIPKAVDIDLTPMILTGIPISRSQFVNFIGGDNPYIRNSIQTLIRNQKVVLPLNPESGNPCIGQYQAIQIIQNLIRLGNKFGRMSAEEVERLQKILSTLLPEA